MSHYWCSVVAGRKLARKDLFTSDPYLVFGVVDSDDSTIDQIPLNSRCFTSQIKMRTLNPKWASVPVELYVDSTRELLHQPKARFLPLILMGFR
jgi:hypothetical protein